MTNIQPGDKVNRDVPTTDQGSVRLGDWAPAFVRPGDKVQRDASTADQTKVRLGDWAPAFRK